MNLRDPDPADFDAWANGLIARSKATPYFHLDGYMNRWWLQRPPGHGAHDDISDKSKTGSASRIHEILRSDTDDHFHCHPWATTSVVLFNSYCEIMPVDQAQSAALDNVPGHFVGVWRRPGDIVQRKATDRHKLVLNEGASVWSLFLMGPWEKTWGFHTPERFVPHREYLGLVEA